MLDINKNNSDKIADKVTEFTGSWRYMASLVVFIFIWIILNIGLLNLKISDPYPFILLNLILGILCTLQSPIIMMSQNRKEAIDRERAENDYMINLKAESEIREINKKLDWIMERFEHNRYKN